VAVTLRALSKYSSTVVHNEREPSASNLLAAGDSALTVAGVSSHPSSRRHAPASSHASDGIPCSAATVAMNIARRAELRAPLNSFIVDVPRETMWAPTATAAAWRASKSDCDA